MAYIGAKPNEKFRVAPTKDSFTGDGSTVAFDLANAVPAGGEFSLQVFIDNVRQEPGSGKAFTIGADGSGDLKRITFTAAPASSSAIYVLTTFDNEAFVNTDLNGNELLLDADGDTSITADTDDQIDIKINGADDFQFTANTFTILSGSTITNSGTASGFVVAGSYTHSKATGDGSTTAFTITSGRAINDVLVFVNGVCLVPTDDYTISGTTLTFATAPASSAEITFRFLPLV
tara:strand:- start:2973 stop:3671 length:699 start_codon:yes stop_codon:yes gene_type:complete